MSTTHHHPRNEALITMAVIAVILHALFILGVNFRMPEPQPQLTQPSLDVILVPPKKQQPKPEEADFLSQQNSQGGTDRKGQSRPNAEPTRPALKQSKKAAEEHIRSGVKTPQVQQQPKVVTTHKASKHQVKPVREVPVKARQKPDVTHLLSSTRQEIARLTAELDRNSQYASQRPRHKAINASTREYRYAAYLDAWRKKVERVGNLNYPDEAKRKKLYGDLLLHVALRSDGSVQQIRVVRSSGYQLLDDAAVRIVRLASPFAPFPEEIRKEIDILDITRTWQFLSNNRLFSGK
ncbi:energy transducer TonB [Thiolapillus brandeum]|uniref:Periplasmic protein TonB n=1 Tax=Thiolapillus brandeum TaxID=1076588 RepID=A0A7U6JIP1_9GAMM|nr:energy transducer TonB [Thiolapillus brandeum]BAO45501.1 periplasmic protein TonB [Thiolapillus brandeum]